MHTVKVCSLDVLVSFEDDFILCVQQTERDETARKLQSEHSRVRQLEEELKNSEMRLSQVQVEAEDAALASEHVLGASRVGALARVRLDSSGARSSASALSHSAHMAIGDGTTTPTSSNAVAAGTCSRCETHVATIERLRDDLSGLRDQLDVSDARLSTAHHDAAALRDQLAECARKKDAEYALLKKDFLAAQVLLE